MSEKCFKCGNGNCNLTVVRFHEKPEWICRECMDNALAFDTPENRAIVERIKGGETREVKVSKGCKVHRACIVHKDGKEYMGCQRCDWVSSTPLAPLPAKSDPAAAQKWNGEAKGLEETQGTDGTKVTGGQHG